MPRVVFVVSRVISALCVVVIVVAAVFDAQAERFTAGRVPAQLADGLDRGSVGAYRDVIGVAHNAGDDVGAATQAVAYGVDAVEIDVRSAGGELFASHDAPVPLLEDVVFRGPSLQEAWAVARLRDTVLLHLKERSRRYLARVRRLAVERPIRRVIVQSDDPATLREVRAGMPSAQRLLLLLDAQDVGRLRRDPSLVQAIDGVSVRDSLLSPSLHAWLETRGLTTFAWTVNDEERLDELVARGIDGVITDRLLLMRLLGEGPEPAGGGER